MLVIREAQMRALEQAAEEDFLWRVARHVIAPRSDRVTGDELLQVTRAGVHQARQYFLKTEAEIAQFLEILWTHFAGQSVLPRSALSILCTHTADTQHKLRKFAEWAAETSKQA